MGSHANRRPCNIVGNRLYSRFPWILGLALSLMVCGGQNQGKPKPSASDSTPPTASFSADQTLFTAPGTLNLSATAQDNVAVTKVVFTRDGLTLAEDTAAPWTFSEAITASLNGTRSYGATAYDAAGNQGSALPVSVTVNIPTSDPTPPKVSLSANPTSFTAPGTLNLTATAQDNVAVTKVVFTRDGLTLAEDTAAPWTFSEAITVSLNGTRSYGATAYDAAGNRAQAPPASVTVNIPSQPSDFSVNKEASFDYLTEFGKRMLATNAQHEYLHPDTGQPFGVMENGQIRTFKSLSALMDSATYNRLFPTLTGTPIPVETWEFTEKSKGWDLFTYENFLKAAAHFPDFGNHGNLHDRLRELAAFLGNIAHETTGGWGEYNLGHWRYQFGLFFKEEVGCETGGCAQYCDATHPQYGQACSSGKTYHGRGPIQLTWNYNYGLMSERLGLVGPTGKLDKLLHQPELLTTDGDLSFRSALWFWQTPQAPKPSCHDVMTRRWVPSADDLAKNRKAGFGTTINIINGNLESNTVNDSRVMDRIGFYLTFLQAFGGSNTDSTWKISPRMGGSSAPGSFARTEPKDPEPAYWLDVKGMLPF